MKFFWHSAVMGVTVGMSRQGHCPEREAATLVTGPMLP